MEITINKKQTFEVIPECLKSEDKACKFIFRTPNTIDMTNFMFMGQNVHEMLFNCFEGFENKIVLKDSKGKQIDYTTYKELMEIGTGDLLIQIHTECALAMTKKVQELQEVAGNTLKKSK